MKRLQEWAYSRNCIISALGRWLRVDPLASKYPVGHPIIILYTFDTNGKDGFKVGVQTALMGGAENEGALLKIEDLKKIKTIL